MQEQTHHDFFRYFLLFPQTSSASVVVAHCSFAEMRLLIHWHDNHDLMTVYIRFDDELGAPLGNCYSYYCRYNKWSYGDQRDDGRLTAAAADYCPRPLVADSLKRAATVIVNDCLTCVFDYLCFCFIRLHEPAELSSTTDYDLECKQLHGIYQVSATVSLINRIWQCHPLRPLLVRQVTQSHRAIRMRFIKRTLPISLLCNLHFRALYGSLLKRP